MTSFARASILTVVAAITLAACGGGGETKDPVLIFGTLDGAIVEFDAASNTVAELWKDPNAPYTLVRDPAVSPDGSRIAFVYAPPRGIRDGRSDVSNDLWIMNRDGSEPRQLYAHQHANETLWYLRWQDDGSLLVVQRRAVDPGAAVGATFTLVRVAADGSRVEPILDGVTAFDLAPDGSRLAVARVRTIGVTTEETLSVIGLAGSDEQVLLGAGQPLAFFGSIRWSPSGDRVGFIALDRDTVFAPKPPGQDAPAGLHTIDLQDPTPNLVTEFDSPEGTPPGVAWQSGEHVYVAGRTGVYVVDIEQKFAERLVDTAAYGQIALTAPR